MKNSLLILAAIVFVGLVVYEWRKRVGTVSSTVQAQANSLHDSDATAHPSTMFRVRA